MPARRSESKATIGAQRGDVVVVVAIRAPASEARETLLSIARHTPAGVPVVLCGDPSEECDPAGVSVVLCGDPAGRRVTGRAGSITDALAAAAPADVALLDSSCTVGEGWLGRLRTAAYADVDVASASPLESWGDLEPPDGMTFARAAAAVAAGSRRLYPRLPAPSERCAYIRRSAIELTGGGEPAFADRCVERGLRHVLADDVLVSAPRSGAAPAAPGDRAYAAAKRALRGLSVAIDARHPGGGPFGGTRVHVLELIAALARTGEAQITVLAPADLDAGTRQVIAELGNVTLSAGDVSVDMAAGGLSVDLVHRPFQISSPADLAYLSKLGGRVVITHQDLISYGSPGYFPDVAGWEGYQRLTRDALALADHVVFFSAHVRDQAIAQELVEPDRATVVHIGVDHAITASGRTAPERPRGAEGLSDFMLCLGTNFQHKNRLFALRLLERLRSDHGWGGQLVLAGPRVRYGSSAPEERRLLAEQPALGAGVVTLDAVTEAEKAWLLIRAALVVYPTVNEGFGLIPFEAAQSGVPCLWAPGSALRELLPQEAAGIVPWDANASAERAVTLLRDAEAREANIDAVRRAAVPLTWDATARRLLDLYRSVCDAPPAPAGVRARAQGLLGAGLSEDAVRLVGPGGALPRELERPLLALATHPAIARPAFGALRGAYSAWTHWRLRRSRTNAEGP